MAPYLLLSIQPYLNAKCKFKGFLQHFDVYFIQISLKIGMVEVKVNTRWAILPCSGAVILVVHHRFVCLEGAMLGALQAEARALEFFSRISGCALEINLSEISTVSNQQKLLVWLLVHTVTCRSIMYMSHSNIALCSLYVLVLSFFPARFSQNGSLFLRQWQQQSTPQ